jgi:TonB family protein
MIKKFDMKLTRIIPSIVLMAFAFNIIAQLPPQTVVFKVRKVDKKVAIVYEKEEEPAFIIVEENAIFQGGDINTFRIWVQQNLIYPTVAAEAGISGRVILQFAVDPKGKVCDARVLRGVNPELDKEAINTVLKSPVWLLVNREGKQ